MEAMRVLIDKDPLAEGFFTGYSSSLERVALRKERYLSPPPPAAAPVVPPPAPHTNSVFGSKLQLALGDRE
jgi:hypothetical protein